MRIYPEQLPQQLSRGLQPRYLIMGDEPLLKQEALDAIRAAAAAQGFSERQRFDIEPQLDWNAVMQAAAGMSLFSECTLLELWLTGKLDQAGSARLIELIERQPAETLLILCIPRLNQTQQKSRWFQCAEQQALLVQVHPPDARRLPQWLTRRLAQRGFNADADAVALLARSTEGNLLAAAQEIEKLGLLFPQGRLTETQVAGAIASHSRFNSFQLVDALLENKPKRAQRMLATLRQEGVEPILVAWALHRELELLYRLAMANAQGQPLGPIFKQQRLWQARQQLLQQALARLPLSRLESLLQQCARLDRQIKQHVGDGDGWEQLQIICLQWCGLWENDQSL